MTDHSGGQQIISEEDAIRNGMEPGDVWLKKIKKAKSEEKDWRTEAARAIALYEGDADALAKAGGKPISFNIYHSNVETMIPAVYNSTPIPDIRRRYDEPDPASKQVVDILERALSFSVDQYDFNGTMVATVRGSLAAGRGVPRVRYKPTFQPQQGPDGQPVIGKDGKPVDVKAYEEATCEVVPWDRFVRGPARSWEQMPWVAFEHDLTQKQITDLAPDKADTISLEGEHGESKDNDAKPDAGIMKTAKVYEVWDKDTGTVFFLEDKKGAEPIKIEKDPLGLSGFFPVPKPLQGVMRESSLTPICPYTIYAPLIEELDAVTKRITKLVRQLRVRGIYDAGLKADLQSLSNADDGTYLPANDATQFASGGGGLEKAIAHFPMEPTVLALRELYTQRDAIKQTIYEVTGMADVVRGASNASETATAQQIKAQYAGLRIQSLQKEVARLACDLFRMKVEIFCNHFSDETLSIMTGIDVRPVAQILRSPQMRAFRIDIETDSTVRADVQRSLEQMSQFIQGTGQFVQAVGGMAQQLPVLVKPMMDVYAAFARKFDLGKQAEDALDKIPQMIEQFMEQQQQAAQQPNPEQVKADMDAKARKAEIEDKRASAALDIDHKKALHAMDIEHKRDANRMQRQESRAKGGEGGGAVVVDDVMEVVGPMLQALEARLAELGRSSAQKPRQFRVVRDGGGRISGLIDASDKGLQ